MIKKKNSARLRVSADLRDPCEMFWQEKLCPPGVKKQLGFARTLQQLRASRGSELLQCQYGTALCETICNNTVKRFCHNIAIYAIIALCRCVCVIAINLYLPAGLKHRRECLAISFASRAQHGEMKLGFRIMLSWHISTVRLHYTGTSTEIHAASLKSLFPA